MQDIRQTPQYAKYLKNIGWIVEQRKDINYFIKRFPPFGSVIKIQRPEEIRYKDIDLLSKKHRAFQIIIEPNHNYNLSIIKFYGFKLSNKPYLPTKTLVLDLTKGEEGLLRGMKKDARSAIVKNRQLSIINYQLSKLEKFRNEWKGSVDLKRYVPPLTHLKALKKSFNKDALFITNNDRSSGSIFLIADKIAYYWQAFSNKDARREQVQCRLVWEGVKWAKKKGCRIFDFEGIYDGRFPDKSWLGFTHFKKSFGGEEVEYPGCYTKLRFPL